MRGNKGNFKRLAVERHTSKSFGTRGSGHGSHHHVGRRVMREGTQAKGFYNPGNARATQMALLSQNGSFKQGG